MTDRGTVVVGGREEWSPRVLPPVPELTPQQQLACAYRILARGGFVENIAGHITMRDPGGDGLWINPWGLWWEEITAGDLCRVDHDGHVLEGRWDVTPAFHIHTELHRRRGDDAAVVIHNHPYHVTVLAALGLVPEMIHQTTAMFHGDLAFVDEYTGEVATAELGAELAERIGDKSVVILANHGVIITGSSVAEATYRAATVDRQCRLMYDVVTSGRPYTVLPESFTVPMQRSLIERGPDYFWGGAVRQLLKQEPEVLS
ncbi:MAG TPA: class II aldolase/adducin family protein [Acidimicrobiales bacterium]|nr:class II aldolase/adducin family protein [Acidimicrobiales bacterium]